MIEKIFDLNEKINSIFIPYQNWINVNTKDKIIEKILKYSDLSLKNIIMEYLFHYRKNEEIFNVEKINYKLINDEYISNFKFKNTNKIKIKLYDILLEKKENDMYNKNSHYKNLVIKFESRDCYINFITLLFKLCSSLSISTKFVYLLNNFYREIPVCGTIYARYDNEKLLKNYNLSDPFSLDKYNLTISIKNVMKKDNINVLIFYLEDIIKIEN
jgi:hypothetical protein